MAVTALACRRLAATRGMQMIVDAAAQAAFVASLAAAVLIGAASIGGFEAASAGPLAVHWAWLAAIWLGIAMLENQSPLFNASQVAMTAAVWFGVGVWLEEQTWFAVSSLPWLDPWTLQAEGVGIVAFCSIWILLRWIARRCIVAPVPTSDGTTAAISLPSRITTLVASNRLAADRADTASCARRVRSLGAVRRMAGRGPGTDAARDERRDRLLAGSARNPPYSA